MDNVAQRSFHSALSSGRPARRVDAHHHLWQYSADEFGWIGEEMASLRRDFLMAEFDVLVKHAGIAATVVVQARPTLEETRWLLEVAASNGQMAGVVGWAPLEDERVAEVLGALKHADKLVGVREMVQDNADGFLDGENFNRGMSQLTRLDLTYDLLVREGQMDEAIRLVDRHPLQRFVLDHAAKPRIFGGALEPWRTKLLELGRRDNVACKVSGLVTEASWTEWTLDTLRPYLDVCVEAFGPHRLMAGSDWPVCLVATEYERWWDVLAEYFENFSSDEVGRVFGETAIEVYRLPLDGEVNAWL
jgi:L-fuconolactonase